MDDALAEWVAEATERMDRLIRDDIAVSGDPFLTATATHLLDAGGKRLRPLLVLLAAQYGDRERPGVVPAAAVVELVHLASLHHDDVVDRSATRRGVDSVNRRWGNHTAVLVGDYLVARAAMLGAALGRESVADQAHTLTRLVRGQLREATGATAGQDPEQHYLEVVADKTASLFALAARLGARAGGAPPAVTRALGDYGEALGIAFQLADDLLDLSAKPEHADLRSGVHTMPVLRALRERGSDAARLRRILARGPVHDPGERATAAALLLRSAAVATTRAEVERYADRAGAALRAIPPSAATEALADLSRRVVARVVARAPVEQLFGR